MYSTLSTLKHYMPVVCVKTDECTCCFPRTRYTGLFLRRWQDGYGCLGTSYGRLYGQYISIALDLLNPMVRS